MPSDERLLSRYENLSEGSNLATATNRGGLARRTSRRAQNVADKLDRRGVDYSGLDIEDFGDPDSFNPATTQGAVGALARFRDRGRDRARFKTRMNKDLEAASVQGYQDEYLPSLDAAAEAADQGLSESAISAGEEATMRSRIAAMNRSAAASRMSRINASMGYGNVANSPAAAALANDIAEDADRGLVSTLADFGLQVSEVNEQQRRKDIDLINRITQARMALTTGDSKTLGAMQGDIAALIDSLYVRDEVMDSMRRAEDAAGDTSLVEQIGGYTDLASGLFSLGSSAAGAFGGRGAKTTTPNAAAQAVEGF